MLAPYIKIVFILGKIPVICQETLKFEDLQNFNTIIEVLSGIALFNISSSCQPFGGDEYKQMVFSLIGNCSLIVLLLSFLFCSLLTSVSSYSHHSTRIWGLPSLTMVSVFQVCQPYTGTTQYHTIQLRSLLCPS